MLITQFISIQYACVQVGIMIFTCLLRRHSMQVS